MRQELERLAVTHANLVQATDNLQQLRNCERESPNWALVTGRESRVFVLEVALRRRLGLARHASLHSRRETLHLLRLARGSEAAGARE